MHADDQSAENMQLQEEMQAFFQKHCKNASALKERGANSNVPKPEDSSAQQFSAKQGSQQAGASSKQQKKKRRQQKKAAQSASPSPSPERAPSASDDPITSRASQSSGAQDHSTQHSPSSPQPAVLADSEPESRASPSPVDEHPSEQQQAEAAKDLGNTQYKAAQYDAALLSYGKAIELCPEVAAYYGNRAAAALMKRQYKLAVRD